MARDAGTMYAAWVEQATVSTSAVIETERGLLVAHKCSDAEGWGTYQEGQDTVSAMIVWHVLMDHITKCPGTGAGLTDAPREPRL